MRKAKWSQVKGFVISELQRSIRDDSFGEEHLRVIINNIYPFSWHLFCKRNKLDFELKKKVLK